MKTEQLTDTKSYLEAMRNHRQASSDALEANSDATFRDDVERMQNVVNTAFPGEIKVITGEQPYGALGKPKVLGKRILSKALQIRNPKIQVVELFANHDLLGSEDGFYRMTIPTNGSAEGVISENLIAAKLRSKSEIASGLSLPNEQVGKQVMRIHTVLPIHYPGRSALTGGPRFDQSIADEWAASYGVNPGESKNNPKFDSETTPPSYAEAHIAWLTRFEERLGLGTDHVTREGDIDLSLARNGGLEVMQRLWKSGLKRLADTDYTPKTLKLGDDELQKTPFNLAQNGARLQSRFKGDGSLVEVFDGKEIRTITLDEAISGNYDFSWRAVPRVVLYSLAGFDGHITGGGSIYNEDAERFLETFGLPYFPIAHMKNGEGVGVLHYASMSSAKKSAEAAKKVSEGKVSLLDLALSCDLDEARELIAQKLSETDHFPTSTTITLANKEGELPK